MSNHLGPLQVVAGRQCLLRGEGWQKLRQDRSAIYDRQLERFNSSQTKDYWSQSGIQDPDLRQNSFRVTKGLPYYLNWIREQRLKGQPLDFAQGNQEIVRLLLQGLNDIQKRVVQLAACCRWFDRKLIEFLAQEEGFAVQTAVDPSRDCFNWLIQKSFVEPNKHRFRLDDVARDVFRSSLWQEDRDRFEQVHKRLAQYFETIADREVPADSSPHAKYENPDWREPRIEFLYHLLFTRRQDVQIQFLTHFLEAHYLGQDEVVQIPLKAVASEMELAEHPMLSYTTRQFLCQIRPAIEQGWAILEEQRIDYDYNRANYGISKAETNQAIKTCLG